MKSQPAAVSWAIWAWITPRERDWRHSRAWVTGSRSVKYGVKCDPSAASVARPFSTLARNAGMSVARSAGISGLRQSSLLMARDIEISLEHRLAPRAGWTTEGRGHIPKPCSTIDLIACPHRERELSELPRSLSGLWAVGTPAVIQPGGKIMAEVVMAPNLNTWILAISALITAITPILIYIMQRRQKVAFAEQTVAMDASRFAAQAAAARAEEVRVTLVESGDRLDAKLTDAARKTKAVRTTLERSGAAIDEKLSAIHDMGNGDRTRMMERLEEMHSEMLRLTVKNNAQAVKLEDQGAIEELPTHG